METQLATLPYSQRCAVFVHEQVVTLPHCCPVTGNPQAGSTLTLIYRPLDRVLEVKSLAEYVASYRSGRDGIRDMEGMIAQIAQDAANAVGVSVAFKGELYIDPSPTPNDWPLQSMRPSGEAYPKRATAKEDA